MATDVELFRGGSYEPIDYNDFTLTFGISTQVVAPTGSVRTTPQEDITAGQDARIVIDGTTVFEGQTQSGGTVDDSGNAVDLEHPAAELWSATGSFNLTTPTDEQVLRGALTVANTQESFTLNYVGTPTQLDSDYDVQDRSILSVYRDMMDRTGRVWRVDPASNTITVEPPGNRGLWNDLDPSDGIQVGQFDAGNIRTVINDVTVIGTGGLATVGNATDGASISTYGRRAETVNVEYALTQTEADNIAASVLQPDPVPEGTVTVPQTVGDITQNLGNFEIDLTDASKDISATGLVVEKQQLRQGRAKLWVGGGLGASNESARRGQRSTEDVTRPGSVYDSERLADDAVLSSKLDDLAVTTAKLADNAVINGKLDDLSVSETKIQDDSIATPKLQAEAVTANEIEADTITAAQIAAGTITALEVATDTLTANEIAADTLTAAQVDTLDLNTGELSVTDGGAGIEFNTATLQGNSRVSMLPTGDAEALLGSDSSAFDAANIDTVELGNELILQSATGILQPANDNEGSVGNSVVSWEEMWAYDFFDASTGTALDGGSALAGLSRAGGYPEHVREQRDGKEGVAINGLSKYLYEVAVELNEERERLQERVADLEQRISRLEDTL